jgi:hypothetical protein
VLLSLAQPARQEGRKLCGGEARDGEPQPSRRRPPRTHASSYHTGVPNPPARPPKELVVFLPCRGEEEALPSALAALPRQVPGFDVTRPSRPRSKARSVAVAHLVASRRRRHR